MSRHASEASSAQPDLGSAKKSRLDKDSPFGGGSYQRGSPRSAFGSGPKSPGSPSAMWSASGNTSASKVRAHLNSNPTVESLIDSLNAYRRDMSVTYAQLAKHSIESNQVKDRRVSEGKDLFEDCALESVPPHKEDTLRIKVKLYNPQNGKSGPESEDHFNAVRIKTVKKAVPLYYSHPVEVEKNVVASQTPMAFYPYKGDTDTAEKQKKQDEYFKELNEVDNHQLGPIKLDQKRGVVIHSERVAHVSVYLDSWLEDLAIEGLNKWDLWLNVPLSEDDDRDRNPQQIEAIQKRCPEANPGVARSRAKMFTKAWDEVFKEERTRHGILLDKIDLFDVLCRNGEIDAVLNPRAVTRTVPEASGNKEEEGFAAFAGFESRLETYASLGCLICFKHSCEHGFYTDDNSRERFSLEKGALARRLYENMRMMVSSQANTSDPGSNPCQRQCYLNWSPDDTYAPPASSWSAAEQGVLRSIFMAATSSLNKADPICHVAALLDRDCVDVHQQYHSLALSQRRAQTLEQHPVAEEVPNLSWYNRQKKKLSKRHGAARFHKPNWDHINRDIDDVCALRGCDHDGPCEPGNKDCPCANKGQLCEKFCGCTVESCAYKFTGCDCRSQGKSCDVKGEDCICIQLNRECDPDLCGSCGVIERADPVNARDEELHSTGCQNCSLQRGVAKKLALGNSQFHGFGLYAAEDIKKDQFIIEYVGELVSGEEGDRRYIRRQNVFEDSKPLSFNFTLLKDCNVWVDGARYGNLSRYVNHAVGTSNKCNVTPKVLLVNGGFRIAFRAKRSIKAWEELLFDYGEDFGIDSDKEKDKKHGQSHKTARKNAPVGTNSRSRSMDESEIESTIESEVESEAPSSADGAESVDLFPEPSPRKRKRALPSESEEDIYQPPSSNDGGPAGSQDESEHGARQSNRLRSRVKASPVKRREVRPAPGRRRGRPRKNRVVPGPRVVAVITNDSSPESTEDVSRKAKRRRLQTRLEISDSDEVVDNYTPRAVPATPEGQKQRSLRGEEVLEVDAGHGEEDEDEEESADVAAKGEEEEEEEEEDDAESDEDSDDDTDASTPRRDQPVRVRRQPSKYKDDEIYGLTPKKRRRRKDVVEED